MNIKTRIIEIYDPHIGEFLFIISPCALNVFEWPLSSTNLFLRALSSSFAGEEVSCSKRQGNGATLISIAATT